MSSLRTQTKTSSWICAFSLIICCGRVVEKILLFMPPPPNWRCLYSLHGTCECVGLHIVCVCSLTVMSNSVTPWIVACQVPLSIEFSRQECWSGLAFFYSRRSSWPRDQTQSPVSPVLAGEFFTTVPTGNGKEKLRLYVKLRLLISWI